MDTELFYAINRGLKNRFFDWLLPLATDHNSWIIVIVALFAYIIWKNPRHGVILFATVVVAVTLGDFINHRLLKEFFARARPCSVLADVNLMTGCSASFSFPSSHAVNSFIIASALWFYERRLWYVTLPPAMLVAFSRVYLGVHYVSDVAVGALIGIFFGYCAIRAKERLPARWLRQ